MGNEQSGGKPSKSKKKVKKSKVYKPPGGQLGKEISK